MNMPPFPPKPYRKLLKIVLIIAAVVIVCELLTVLFSTPVSHTRTEPVSKFGSSSAPAATPLTATPSSTPTPTPSPTPLTPAALEEAAAQFPLRITDSNYILGLTNYSGDAFQATLENTSDQDILDARIFLAAWDSNGLPIDLSQDILKYDGINLVPQGTFSDAGYKLYYDGASDRISYYKAIVADYTTAQGITIENGFVEDWVAMFVGKKLDLSQETFSSPQEMMEAGALNGTLSALKNISPSTISEETSYGGTVTPTENGFLFTYDFQPGFMEGNETLTQGYGNAFLTPMVTYGAPLFEELHNALQTRCGVEAPVFTVSLVDDSGNVVYSEDITSDIIDTMGSIF